MKKALGPAPGRDETLDAVLSISGLTKTYDNGFHALKGVDLAIRRGEIFALLGPNGAGKTTLIGIVCGLVRPTRGAVLVDGADIATDYRAARKKIGLVPQELAVNMFETVWDTVVVFARAVRQAGQSSPYRAGAARPLAVGQEGLSISARCRAA